MIIVPMQQVLQVLIYLISKYYLKIIYALINNIIDLVP